MQPLHELIASEGPPETASIATAMPSSRRLFLVSAAACLPALWPMSHSHAAAFDHTHIVFTGLLKRHVVLLGDGQASQIRYANLATDRSTLKAYLSTLSAVTEAAFSAFSLAQQQAFLINAYNGFTLELILTKYPALNSIKDLG